MTDDPRRRAASRTVEVAVERGEDGVRTTGRDRVVVEAPLQLRARGVPVATVMRTPGHDLELVRGLLHAESVAAGGLAQAGDDAVEIDVEATAFAARGLLASAACGVCGRVAIADLERRARSVETDATSSLAVLATLPAKLRAAQQVFDDTGGLHAAALCTLAGELVAVREDVGRHNAVDKVAGWALAEGVDPGAPPTISERPRRLRARPEGDHARRADRGLGVGAVVARDRARRAVQRRARGLRAWRARERLCTRLALALTRRSTRRNRNLHRRGS